MYKFWREISLILILAGCSSAPKNENHAIDQLLVQDVGDIDQSMADRIMSEPCPYHSQSRQKVEGEIRQKVRWWIHYFTVNDRDRFKRNLERGEKYKPLIQQLLWQSHLPGELYYLAMIESGFVNHATSEASAVGIWQFMVPTAVNYGLSVEPDWDERTHPVAATVAATRYLEHLHQQFNSWYLAIAAYNAGQGRVQQAVREGRTRDFWQLVDGGFLPHETMDYIPKFLAAATIGEHLKQFGFEALPKTKPWPMVAKIDLKISGKKTTVSQLVRQTQMSEQDLLRFNPQLARVLSSGHPKKIKLWVSQAGAESYQANERRVVVVNGKPKKLPPDDAQM